MKTIIYILIIISTLFIQSCSNKELSIPELPPKESFTIDFTDFVETNKTESSNWQQAKKTILIWDTLINKKMEVPIASFPGKEYNVEPTYQSENKWLWEYSFPENINSHSAKLFGTLKGSSIYWEMFISKEGEYKDFMWFFGNSASDNKSVNWTIFNSPDDNTEKLKIEYEQIAEGIYKIDYIDIIIEEDIKNNSFLKFDNNNDNENFKSKYQIYNKENNNLIEIEYSPNNKNGRVIDSFFFKDNIWHCWAIDYKNIDCE